MVIGNLTELFQAELGYSAINNAQSALSAYTMLEGSHQVGGNSMISRFVKRVYQIRIPLPKYQNTWDVSLLLNFLRD